MPRLTQVFAPQDRLYFELFEEASQNILRASELLDRMLSNFPDSKELADSMCAEVIGAELGACAQIEGPITAITNQPGLGVEVDWELVRKLRPR